MTIKTAVTALAIAAVSACAADEPGRASKITAGQWARMTDGMDAFMERVEATEYFPPGAAVILVTDDGRRYVRLHGETKAGSGREATGDTAFYIASMTKAYMGLLAARLDAEGVLPLATTLDDVWPGLKLPAGGRRADAITLRDLIVHSIPFEVEEITFLEAYVRDVAPSEYPALIEKYAVARQDGFQYDNLGYNIYAAALEAKTGKNWRDWLKEKVFSPLKMTATSGRTSDYAADKIAWSHQRAGAIGNEWPSADGWRLIAPKTDGMMQSAGGLMTSANDMALWLEAQAKGAGPRGSGLTPDIFGKARQDVVPQPSDGHGFSCGGYVYGWGVCDLLIDAEQDAAGENRAIGPFYQHGGGYIGVRSLMTVAPELGFGVAFLSNADSMTGYLSNEIAKLAFELQADIPGGDARSEKRIEAYRARNASYLAYLQETLQKARAEERWRGWEWAPGAAALSAYAGYYENEGALLPDASVELEDGVLFLTSGERRHRLTPAAPDLFGAQSYAYDEIGAVEFVRGPDDAIVALEWDGAPYEKR